MKPDRVLVTRLLEHYDAFGAIGLVEAKVRELLSDVEPVAEYVDNKQVRSGLWHVGRIRRFVENPSSDPIEVDNDCHFGSFGPPIVIDGHHRLCAAVIRGDKRITASYSGLVSTLEWLKGKRKTCPVG